MGKSKTEDLSDFLYCLSVLEEKTRKLFEGLAEKVLDLPLVKSLLLQVAHDSQKHSAIFKGISESISRSKRPDDCEKIGPAWKAIENLASEISSTEKIGREGLTSLIEKLMVLESTVGEEYYVLVQTKTLRYMTKEVSELYNVDLDDMKGILENIITDEEIHGELLQKIKRMIMPRKEQKPDATVMVEYEDSDAWSTPVPGSGHETVT